MMFFQRFTWIILFVCLISVPLKTFAVYDSGICANAKCTQAEVGPFMQNITKECGNLGNCSLDDIMEVVGNVGNFVAGIVGGIVLLMYVIGGIFYITAAGDRDKVGKAKKYLKGSTVGLLIVLFAFLGIQFLQSTLGVKVQNGTIYAVCDGKSGTEGKDCGAGQQCAAGKCIDKCLIDHSGTWSCQSPSIVNDEKASKCESNKCGNEGLCCAN